eukprot:s928_g6.t1
MDAAKVSRIKAPRKDLPQNLWRPPQKRLFLAPAIEATLQRRQLLQPLTAKSVPSLRPKTEEDLYKDTLTKEKSSEASLWGQEAWLSILTGENRVEIPFSEIGAASHGEEYIQWYEDQRAQKRAAEPSTARRGSLMPLGFWRSALTDFALSSLQPSPGECVQLKGRASLLRHLEANATAQGPKALAESISFRFGGEDRAVLALKKSFGEQMSLLDFAATCGVLDLDLDLLGGEDWPLLLANLFPGTVTIDCGAALAIRGDFETPNLEFQRRQGKWWLLGRYLGLSGLRAAAGDKSQSWEDLKLRLDVQLKHLELCMKPCFMASIGPREAASGPAARQLSQDEWLLFFKDLGEVDARWRNQLNEVVLRQAFEKAANEGMLTFEAFKGALKNVVEALPGAWDSLMTVAKSAVQM